MFEEQDYGFALQQGSPYRKGINKVLLHMIRSGDYMKIYKRWM